MRQLAAKLSSTTLFLQELVLDPKQVGAFLPSSRQLAEAMALWMPLDADGFVLELGPGTGVVTQALLDRGLPQDRLVAIEQSPKMADHLRSRFPRAKIITGDAFQLDKLLRPHLRRTEHVRVVFSSLPLRNFKAAAADKLAQKIRSVLPPGGKLIQYSYHIWNKRSEAADHFKLVASDVIWPNFPPARVSVYQK
jgi:phosphatidylethanolamine/phosphatidyl-N-methylethanolamine N-methyltransferase